MKSLIFEGIGMLQRKVIGPFKRNLGKRLYQTGTRFEAQFGSEDRLVPSLRKLNYFGVDPDIQNAQFVAPNAVVAGNVKVGYRSSIWYGATIIGSTPIRIGQNCVIQDRAHISRDAKLEDYVFVGPNSVIQGSRLHRNSFISMGATVRHSTVEANGFVAAGAVIPDNVVVKEGQVWAGNPGKYLRNVTAVEREVLREYLAEMQDLAAIHSEETEKTSREVIVGPTSTRDFDLEDFLADPDVGLNMSDIDQEFVEYRAFMRQKSEYPEAGKDYEPYSTNLDHMSEKFKVGIHEQEFRKVATKIKQKEIYEHDNKPWKDAF